MKNLIAVGDIVIWNGIAGDLRCQIIEIEGDRVKVKPLENRLFALKEGIAAYADEVWTDLPSCRPVSLAYLKADYVHSLGRIRQLEKQLRESQSQVAAEKANFSQALFALEKAIENRDKDRNKLRR